MGQTHSSHEITGLLRAWSDGDQAAFEKLIPLVQSELHRLADLYLRRENAGHILQTTALVNEVYIKLIDWTSVRFEDRKNFYGVAAMLMRRVLVDYVRHYPNQRRLAVHIEFEEMPDRPQEQRADLIALDEALQSLARLDERKCRIVELRFFGGLSIEETAEALSISPSTVKREWRLAQAWLYLELGRGETSDI